MTVLQGKVHLLLISKLSGLSGYSLKCDWYQCWYDSFFFREKYAMMFDEPVLLQLGWWYVAWARVSGPSSDCGSHGQATITTDDG